MATDDRDWVPSIKMDLKEIKPVAKSAKKILVSKPQVKCAAPATKQPLVQIFLDENSSREGGNNIQFAASKSEPEDYYIVPDFISPDLPLYEDPLLSCPNQNCLKTLELNKRLQSQLNESQAELEAVRRELYHAKEKIATLRSQLELNTTTLLT